jgi:hypothetical protein
MRLQTDNGHMKKYLPLVLLFSITSHAQNMTAEIKQGLALLSNPSSFLKPEHCEPGKPDTAQWCSKQFSWACIVDASSEKAEKFKKKVDVAFDDVDFEDGSDSEINAAYKQSLLLAEKEMFAVGSLKSQDLNKFFDDQKQKLAQVIKEQPLSASKQADLIKKVQATKLVMPSQYIANLEAYAFSKYPNEPKNKIRKQAMESYTESCGDSSHRKEIFFEANSIVICPGKIVSLQEKHIKSKDEALDAITPLLGRALGQAIDSDEEPSIYKNMGQCYKTLLNNQKAWSKEMAAALSADFWGAQLFAARLMARNIKGHDVIKTIANGFQHPYCYDDNYKTTTFRIDRVFSLTPGTRELMACGKTSEAPACGL